MVLILLKNLKIKVGKLFPKVLWSSLHLLSKGILEVCGLQQSLYSVIRSGGEDGYHGAGYNKVLEYGVYGGNKNLYHQSQGKMHVLGNHPIHLRSEL